MNSVSSPSNLGRKPSVCEIAITLSCPGDRYDVWESLVIELGDRISWTDYRSNPYPNILACARCSVRQIQKIVQKLEKKLDIHVYWRVFADGIIQTNDTLGEWFPEKYALVAVVDGNPPQVYLCSNQKELIQEVNFAFGSEFRSWKDTEKFMQNPGFDCSACVKNVEIVSTVQQ